MFFNAEKFNTDLSKWNPVALKNGDAFIHWWTENNAPSKLIFSRANYDKLLQAWDGKVNPKDPKILLTIKAPYCLGKDARDDLRAKRYDIR